MVLMYRFLALPPALLGLILDTACTAQARDLEWPYNLPPYVKYYPEHEALIKRNLQAQQKLYQNAPTGMKKMSGDPGEKFFFEYWQFEQDQDEYQSYNNASMPADLSASFPLHSMSRGTSHILPRLLGTSFFAKRSFECPAGSEACISINRPNSCCETGSTCQLVQDVGLGDVGCCAANQVCAGSVSNCPDGGYTKCPTSPNGGCCLPGYACLDVGCVATSTAVVVVAPTPSTTSSASTSSAPLPPPTPPPPSSTTELETETETTTTTVLPPPPPSTAMTTTTETTSPTATSPPSTSAAPNTLICSSGFRSCPASLGGGCCPTDRACGRDVCPEIDSTDSFTAPGRPTSNSGVATLTTTTSASSFSTDIGCPTGFYACNAYYGGGCCQTGRNCEVTSCPAGGSITVVDGSVTAVAPTGSGVAVVQTLLTGACANGWSTCPPDVGGGCCPAGYACGSVCTATATAAGQGSEVGKIAPNGARSWGDREAIMRRVGWSLGCVGAAFVIIA